MTAAPKTAAETFSFSSSVKADAAHPQNDPQAYEWWYFDALSDDGKEAVVIIFLDNFIFSPRYNQFKIQDSKFRSGNQKSQIPKPESQILNFESPNRFPAIAFVYYRDGKPVYRALNEFGENDFAASTETAECRIGESSFTTETASYGSGYLINIKANLSRKRRLEASFEWLSIESDLTPEKCDFARHSHCWNMVAPRSDVTGKITVFDRNDRESDVRHFRGTGYHDHNLDHRWLPETVKDWQWGRVHFADATAVFYRYREIGNDSAENKLLIVRDGKLHEFAAEYEAANFSRDKFGIKYPTRLTFKAPENIRLRVKHQKIIDSSFFYLRFLSEMTLTLHDEKPRRTIGITEYLAPEALKYRWLHWLVNMRIGRGGKGAFLG